MTTDEFDYGNASRMDDDEIRGFLSSQHVGVLGLDAGDAPSLRPMSFWFDGEAALYFLYVLGDDSRKEALTRRTDTARFLVYRAETPFNWRSVLLTGTIREVPADELEAVSEAMDLGRRPDAIATAAESERTGLYRLRIDEQTGIEHLGLPPEFEE
ncbi:MAG: pyridoxamine 5'-phosphate oxidase family protein [Haloplanus sp.]